MILKDQKVYIGGVEMTSDTNNIALEHTLETKDRTTFGHNSRVKVPGLKDIALGLNGFFSSEDDAAKEEQRTLENAPVVITKNGHAVGDEVYFFLAAQASYGFSGAVGEFLETNLSAVGTGDLANGVIAQHDEALVASASGAAQNLGPVAAGKKLVACVQVLAVADPADTVQVNIESDSADDFSGAETTRIAFPVKNEVGAQIIEVEGPIADTWYRADTIIAGAAPSADVLVTIAIV